MERRQKLMKSARTCGIVGSDKIPLANKLCMRSIDFRSQIVKSFVGYRYY